MEHYVTLFDHKFLPQGLALHASLQAHASPCQLWVVCMDQLAETQLRRLDRPGLQIIRLAEIEDPELLTAKANRNWTEYCWTLTPTVCLHILREHTEVTRVTYVDADLAFFKSPQPFFAELEGSGKKILLTEHAYDPQYAHLAGLAGRFCVQFLTFSRHAGVIDVLTRWRNQCLQACTSTASAGSGGFGDQMYLEEWPERYPDHVHILSQQQDTLAPWNVDYYQKRAGLHYLPVFYHFHSFRILSPSFVRLSSSYRITLAGHIYDHYLALLDRQVGTLLASGIPLPTIPLTKERFWLLKNLKRYLFQHLSIRRHPFPEMARS